MIFISGFGHRSTHPKEADQPASKWDWKCRRQSKTYRAFRIERRVDKVVVACFIRGKNNFWRFFLHFGYFWSFLTIFGHKYQGRHTMGQSNQECKETSETCLSHVEKLELRFLHNKNKWTVTHLILGFAMFTIYYCSILCMTIKFVSHVEKLELRFLHITHLILGFAILHKKLLVWNFVPFHSSYCIWLLLNFGRNIVKKKLDSLTHKLLPFHYIITHIYENHIKFEVSLHFWRIWPSVRRGVRRMYSQAAKNHFMSVFISRYFTH